ncbi:class I SAM-dependent methyltransferase [Streptomyces hainanensis]|uniref:Class I SAM-dependent methyltransferase n=1 Tax=Streptomyces hainanensis TaxID=402648 RepID=A0A4R4TGE9_9ACTN|nr:class I SAM-dependent methyltransferase [Streptomyces hainanensis]TDC76560.1 class I SAM-dependent methyltransferase [Streptomyces hainanensis]
MRAILSQRRRGTQPGSRRGAAACSAGRDDGERGGGRARGGPRAARRAFGTGAAHRPRGRARRPGTRSHPELARARVAAADRLLDVDTGGGELLASLGPLPRHSWATEGWPPNVAVARERLEPLGVTVLPTPGSEALPLPDASVDVVLNRHGRLAAREVARVLRPGGVLLTQQVGSDDRAELNAALGAPPARPPGSWDLGTAGAALSARWSTSCAWWPGRSPTSTRGATTSPCAASIGGSARRGASPCARTAF